MSELHSKMIFFDHIAAVEEIKPVLRTEKSADGRIIETLGIPEWHIVLRNSHMRLNVGSVRPLFRAADLIRISLERINPAPEGYDSEVETPNGSR